MVQITENPTHDAVADLKVVDAYMRWALEAAEEVVGKDGLAVVLRDAKLERFINNYPADLFDPVKAWSCVWDASPRVKALSIRAAHSIWQP